MSFVPMMIPGTLMIIFGLTIRMFAINRLPKITFVIIWVLVCLRLIVPFAIPLFSIPISMPNTASGDVSNLVGVHMLAHDEVHEWQFVVMEPHSQVTNNFLSVFTGIWLAGAAIAALYFIINHIKFRRAVKDSIPIREDFVFDWQHKISRPVKIHSSDKISSPLTYGILWPVILLPSSMDWDNDAQLQYILSHEYVHIKRFDCVIKMLFAITLCLHWFNPFVWIMFILANRDIELSCDEAILNAFGRQAKIDYAMTLLDMMENSDQHKYATCNFANLNKKAVEERFTILAAAKHTSILGSILAIILIALPMLFIASDATQSHKHIVFGTTHSRVIGIEGAFLPEQSFHVIENFAHEGSTAIWLELESSELEIFENEIFVTMPNWTDALVEEPGMITVIPSPAHFFNR